MNQNITAPKQITSLAELQALTEKPIYIRFRFCDQDFEVEARRLRPSEDAALEQILGVVIPPIIRGKTMDDDRPNYNDQEYIKRRLTSLVEARALGLYWCIPIFAQDKPGLSDTKSIVEYIQSKFDEQILQLFWNGIRNGGVTLYELVNFTSTSGSAQS